MPIYLTEEQVGRLLTMPDAVDAVEGAFGRQALGEVINLPRRRLQMPAGTYQAMAAADLGLDLYGAKTYGVFQGKARFLFLLYSASAGDLLALMEADRLGQMRTGAATGVAARYLARRPAEPLRVGIYGTGWQAESQLEAIAAVTGIRQVSVWSRDAEHRGSYCARMSRRLGLAARAASSAEEAAANMDVVVTATTAREPVLEGAWLAPGTLVCAMGSNMLSRREVDDETVRRAAPIVVDSKEQARLEAGDLLGPLERRLFRWEQVVELSSVVARGGVERAPEDIVLFKSLGVALEDVAAAAVVYRKAVAEGVGERLEMWA